MSWAVMQTGFQNFLLTAVSAASLPSELLSSINTVWTLISAFLVFFMQAGFAMLEGGSTRSKGIANIMMKNLMDFCIGSIVFYFIGYGLMFGQSVGGLFGSSGFFGAIDHAGMTSGIPTDAFILWETVFCATAATIVSGAMAERTKFIAYCIYSAVISLVIYPVAGHWIWGGGWLAQIGFEDFAGSTVVHSIGGWAALVGAAMLGPRIGKYSKDGKPNSIPGHSIALSALGVFILWFGWFGFNPGSTLSALAVDDKGVLNIPAIGTIAMTTNIAAAAGACSAMIYTWIRHKKPSVSMSLNGAIGGLVAITAGCAYVSIEGALVIGLLAGVLVVASIEFYEKVLKIDDPAGAISCHCTCGVFGTLMVGLFDTGKGLFYGGGVRLLGVQALGVLCVAAWVLATTFVLFKVLKSTVGLRVSAEEELAGLDVSEHAEEGYPDFQQLDTIHMA
ncbi:ammonium transporter [Caproiciproducens sp. NJN-50]|uniref:ammonium transporter n=1 Tax=Caproiciproducens sp. NJN-50 TaxID=2507162 RepID=UPI001FAA0EFD|nr:ammonium transporter [Caproiciproducens sp. NJN-50]